jgi:hypothetical protein
VGVRELRVQGAVLDFSTFPFFLLCVSDKFGAASIGSLVPETC